MGWSSRLAGLVLLVVWPVSDTPPAQILSYTKISVDIKTQGEEFTVGLDNRSVKRKLV